MSARPSEHPAQTRRVPIPIIVSRCRALRESLLCHALEGKAAYELLHAYPVPFETLYEGTRAVVVT